MSHNLAPVRRFIQPESGDDWPGIAARVMPGEPAEAAIEQLRAGTSISCSAPCR